MEADSDSHDEPRPPTGVASPVSTRERLVSLDTLRGIAVLGILVMNIYAFAMPFMAYSNPLAMGGTETYNLGTWFFTHIFFDQKFMSIFAMLFGAGLILMAEHAEAKGANFKRIFYRRQLWLLILGALHGYFIWFGDILFHYALVGMIVYLFRRRPPKTLMIVACLALPIAPLLSFAGGKYMEDLKARAENLTELANSGEELSEEQQETVEEWAEARGFIVPGPEELRADVDAYSGGYAGIVAHRASVVFSFQTDGTLAFIIWRVGGLMLIGMALMKLGVLSAARSNRYYRNLMLIGYGAGLPLTIFSAANLYAHDFDSLYVFTIGMVPNYIGSVLVAFGHIGLVMLIVRKGVRTGPLRSLMARFAAVGRMALSNYLMHSLVLTSVFYGYGLGLYTQVPRFWQMAFVVVLVGGQLLLCPWWLARYRFGPVEWAWRSLTYRKRQPMRQVA